MDLRRPLAALVLLLALPALGGCADLARGEAYRIYKEPPPPPAPPPAPALAQARAAGPKRRSGG